MCGPIYLLRVVVYLSSHTRDVGICTKKENLAVLNDQRPRPYWMFNFMGSSARAHNSHPNAWTGYSVLCIWNWNPHSLSNAPNITLSLYECIGCQWCDWDDCIRMGSYGNATFTHANYMFFPNSRNLSMYSVRAIKTLPCCGGGRDICELHTVHGHCAAR